MCLIYSLKLTQITDMITFIVKGVLDLYRYKINCNRQHCSNQFTRLVTFKLVNRYWEIVYSVTNWTSCYLIHLYLYKFVNHWLMKYQMLYPFHITQQNWICLHTYSRLNVHCIFVNMKSNWCDNLPSEWVSEWLLFNANSAIFQLYYDKNKLIFNEMTMRSTLF